jgi:hypothetical protein
MGGVEIPNAKSPNAKAAEARTERWVLVIGILLGFGFWRFGFCEPGKSDG